MSSVWPWSGAPKSKFVRYICKRLTSFCQFSAQAFFCCCDMLSGQLVIIIVVNTTMIDIHANMRDRKQSGGRVRPDWMWLYNLDSCKGLTWRNQLGYPAHTGLMSPSVCLFVRLFHMKTRRIFTLELKSGCLRGVFCPLFIPSEYLFLCARRKFGFNKKIHTKLLIVYVYFQPNSCNTHTDCEWAQGTFLRVGLSCLEKKQSRTMKIAYY